jgi:hypothetical protein
MKIFWSQNFKEFMRFFPKGLNPFENSIKIQIGFASEFYNSKFREIWKLSQRGKLFNFKFYITMPCLEIFGIQEGGVL